MAPPSHTPRILGVDYSTLDFEPYKPLGLSITVEGSYLELCQASNYFGSEASCEYIVSGFQPSPFYGVCCPKGVTAYYSPSRLQGLAGASAPSWTTAR